MTSQRMKAESGVYFTREGADVGEQKTITAPKRGRPKGSKNKPKVTKIDPDALAPSPAPGEVGVHPLPKPSAPDLGKMIVEFCAQQADWKPTDWRTIQTALSYAHRHGRYWHELTKKQ